ncbi:aldo/keto reductase [Prosthecobacter sp.]|jgi:aryl-alcohol dehydrogenase-like predicted oxidoreductase|uniref:aldo/keto reductase n=1 Tax=Prosthecobacter sp. TaxID=1965333 RepID=UPI003782F366
MLPASRIGLGCVTFGREIDEAASFALLDHALARGITHFDTAAAYGGGASEIILGKWLASRKPVNITVATKILPPYDHIDVTPSLQRLGVDHIDLLYLHQWHDSALKAGAALEKLPVSRFGASNVTLDQLRDLEPRFSVIQNNHNLAVSDVSDDLRDYCAAHEIAIVTYSPLGAGFLTGKHQNGVQAGSRFEIIPGHQQVYFHDAAYKRLARLEATAKRTGHSQAHLALAWALHQPGIACTLIGGRTPAHIDQAFAALDFADEAVLSELTA